MDVVAITANNVCGGEVTYGDIVVPCGVGGKGTFANGRVNNP